MLHSREYRLCRLSVCITAVVSMCMITAHAQRKTDEPILNEPQGSVKKLFAQRRKDHLEAVQTLLKMDNYEQLYKMIMVLAEKIIETIKLSRSVIEKAGFVPNNSSFPEDTNVKDALSNILENIALFGDIVLHLPDITHRILRAQQQWNSTIYWSLNFANRTRYLLNKSTITMIHLVEQELNITERDSNYFNPYRTIVGKQENDAKEKKRKQQFTKKDKRKRGPQIVKIEL